MRWIIVLLALVGIAAASLALREHYRTEASPCSINEKWDCGVVNKSPYAVIGGILDLLTHHNSMEPDEKRSLPWLRNIPVADIGIAGYLLLGILALAKRWRLLVPAAVGAMLFSLFLAHVEKDVLGVWCIYCVMSLAIISLITISSIVGLIVAPKRNTEQLH